MAAAKARKSHEPRMRVVPPVRLKAPEMSNVTITDVPVARVETKVKTNLFKKLCKKATAMFATKK